MNPTQKTPDTMPNGGSASQQDAALTARRRILRGGLSAAPVLMVSAPRSVMAGTLNCVPASSFASINASRPESFSRCSGRTPSYWKQQSNWPGRFERGTLFNDVFVNKYAYRQKTLLQVLDLPGSAGEEALAKYIVAALLNAAAGLTLNVLDVGQVKAIWRDYAMNSFYTPTAGIRWYPDYAEPAGSGGITLWLKSTMSA